MAARCRRNALWNQTGTGGFDAHHQRLSNFSTLGVFLRASKRRILPTGILRLVRSQIISMEFWIGVLVGACGIVMLLGAVLFVLGTGVVHKTWPEEP